MYSRIFSRVENSRSIKIFFVQLMIVTCLLNVLGKRYTEIIFRLVEKNRTSQRICNTYGATLKDSNAQVLDLDLLVLMESPLLTIPLPMIEKWRTV